MTQIIERIGILTAAELVAAIEKLAPVGVELSEVYVKGAAGVALERETLSDASEVFNLVLTDSPAAAAPPTWNEERGIRLPLAELTVADLGAIVKQIASALDYRVELAAGEPASMLRSAASSLWAAAQTVTQVGAWINQEGR